jgi:hypothetical protein
LSAGVTEVVGLGFFGLLTFVGRWQEIGEEFQSNREQEFGERDDDEDREGD